MKRHAVAILALAVLALAPTAALAQSPAASSAKASSLSDGEVRKVDKASGTGIIKHGEIRNLGMGPMTMEFRASDPKLLESLKPGDRIRFAAVMAGSQLTVTRIEPAK